MSIAKSLKKAMSTAISEDGSYIVIVGRGDNMHYFDKYGTEYFINFEMINSDKYNASILSYYIAPIDADSYDILSNTEKDEILNQVLKLCTKRGWRVKVDYKYYTEVIDN